MKSNYWICYAFVSKIREPSVVSALSSASVSVSVGQDTWPCRNRCLKEICQSLYRENMLRNILDDNGILYIFVKWILGAVSYYPSDMQNKK